MMARKVKRRVRARKSQLHQMLRRSFTALPLFARWELPPMEEVYCLPEKRSV